MSRDLEDLKPVTEDEDVNSQTNSPEQVEKKTPSVTAANEDDDSSSCGSSSSSDSSDSDSEKEDEPENADSTHTDEIRTSNGNDTVASSGSNPALRTNSSTSTSTESNRLRNVNSNRAAARFRQQQNAELGLMALGTKKRDRRTIEEIQRDIQKKRGKPTCPTNGNLQNCSVKKSASNSSPALSSDSGVEPATVLSLNASKYNVPKGKANSARSRLAMKVFGRGGRSGSSNAKSKKNTPNTVTTGIVTNISAGTMKKTTTISESNEWKGDRAESVDNEKSDRQIESLKSDSCKNVRYLMRSMLRYGDLAEVDSSLGDTKTYADEYKLPNFIHRSNLCTLTKLSEEKLLKWAVDITEMAQNAIEKNQESIKFMEVEIKPSQLVARLYDNLKLRVAVQRALRDANCSKPTAGGMLTNGAYVLVAKQSDYSVLNIAKDCQAWVWAEKEHEWNQKKDIALLLGVYVHGFGCWEDILNDDLLHLHQQRALKGDRLRKRAENLMKKLPPPDGVVDPIIVYKAYALLADTSPTSSQSQHQPSDTSTTTSSNKGRTQLQRANDKMGAKVSSGSIAAVAEVSNMEKKKEKDISVDVQVKGKRKRSASSSPPTASKIAKSDENSKLLNNAVGESDSDAHSMHSAPTSPIAKPFKNGDTMKSKIKQGSTKRMEKLSAEAPDLLECIPALTMEEMVEKWNPSKQLKDIRQVLKKLRIMAEWSKTRQDDLVVEKMLKYVTVIGSAIDHLVVERMDQNILSHKKKKHRNDVERPNWKSDASPEYEMELDGYSTCLWTFAASFTPFHAVQFEQLYDDMCADANTIRQRENTMLESLTEEELALKRSVQDTLQTRGILSKLKAELRSAIFQVLHDENVESKTGKTVQRRDTLIAGNSREYELSLQLCLDFLQTLELDHTFSVLKTEANCIKSHDNADSKRHLLEQLKLSPATNSCEKPVLFDLVKTFCSSSTENQRSSDASRSDNTQGDSQSGEDSDSAPDDTAPEILSAVSTIGSPEREAKSSPRSSKLAAFLQHGYHGTLRKGDDANMLGDQVDILQQEDEANDDDDERQLGTLDAKLQAMEADDDTGILEKLRESLQIDHESDPDHENNATLSLGLVKMEEPTLMKNESVDQDANYGSDFEEEFEEEIASEISEASSLEEASQSSALPETETEIDPKLLEQIQKDKVVQAEIALESYDYIEAIEHSEIP